MLLASIALASSLLSVTTSEIVSLKSLSAPADLYCACWLSSVCPSVDTLAYPTIILASVLNVSSAQKSSTFSAPPLRADVLNFATSAVARSMISGGSRRCPAIETNVADSDFVKRLASVLQFPFQLLYGDLHRSRHCRR